VIDFAPRFVPELPLASNDTVKTPELLKTWLGFLTELIPPSPKSHCQDVGVPEVVSENCTVCPGLGVTGLNTKVASAWGGNMVSVRLAVLLVVSVAATSLTLRNPEAL
jgi:hypothetical protein